MKLFAKKKAGGGAEKGQVRELGEVDNPGNTAQHSTQRRCIGPSSRGRCQSSTTYHLYTLLDPLLGFGKLQR